VACLLSKQKKGDSIEKAETKKMRLIQEKRHQITSTKTHKNVHQIGRETILNGKQPIKVDR